MFDKDPLLSPSRLLHSPHQIIPTLVSPNSVILDVGCNTGYLGQALKETKNVVTDGLDINQKALSIAQKYYRHTYLRDLSVPYLKLPQNKYDYLIFSDILEHLPRPDLILQDSRHYLKPHGHLIISLPNIARFEIRLKLLFGHFDYSSAGILSQDHLRFFTRDSAFKLIESCGFKVEKILPTGLGHTLKIFPTLTAFQFIYLCCLPSSV